MSEEELEPLHRKAQMDKFLNNNLGESYENLAECCKRSEVRNSYTGYSYSDDNIVHVVSREYANMGSIFHNSLSRVALSNSRARSRSLCHFDLDEYTLGEIKMLHESLSNGKPPSIASSSLRHLKRRQILTLASLCMVDFFSFCSMSIMAPFFPREASVKGMSDTMSGVVFAFYALVMFATSPIVGKVLPNIGTKFLFMSGMFIAGSCQFLFGLLVYIEELWLFTVYCFAIRGLQALGASCYSTATYVYVVEIFPANIGAVLGILETFVGLGMSTGPAIGGFLYRAGGFGLPFYSLGIIMVAVVPLNLCLLPVISGSNVTHESRSVKGILKIPSGAVVALIIVMASSIWGFLDPTLEPHLRQFDLTPEMVGLIFLLFAGLYGISSPLWGYISDKFHNQLHMMTTGLLMCSLGLLLLGPVPCFHDIPPSLGLNLIAISILGLSVALSLLPTFQAILDAAFVGGYSNELSTYSMVAGSWACLYALGEVIGPVAGGMLTEHYGFPVACTVMAAATFLVTMISLVYQLMRAGYNYESTEICGSGCFISRVTPSDNYHSQTLPLLKMTCTGRNISCSSLQEKVTCKL